MSYGFCPRCGAPGKSRERRPNGNDTCERGCVYPSMSSMATPIANVDPPPPRLERDDLELVDALVANGCISRPVGREVAASAQPGRVASFIMERGLCNLAAHSGYTIVERLAKYERAEAEEEALALFGSGEPGDPTLGGRLRDQCDKPETD